MAKPGAQSVLQVIPEAAPTQRRALLAVQPATPPGDRCGHRAWAQYLMRARTRAIEEGSPLTESEGGKLGAAAPRCPWSVVEAREASQKQQRVGTLEDLTESTANAL